MPQAACPFCFRRVNTSRLAYQCTNRGAKECTSAIDDQRVALTGSKAMSFTTFDAPTGRGVPATCPTCGSVATRRACPECHTAVPVDFVDSDSPMFGIVGSKGSGKTVLMTVLVKQLLEVVGKRFGAAVRLATDNPDGSAAVAEYKADREDRLFKGQQLPMPTQQNQNVRRGPLALLWQGQQERLIGGQRLTSTILSFVDTAGEDLNDLDTAFTLQYLSVCDGLIITLDPFSIPGARARVRLPQEAIQSSDGTPKEVLARLTELLRTDHRVKRNRKIALPVAIVFTKFDAFFGGLERTGPIMSEAPNVPAYHEADGQAVHEHVKALLHEWDAADIDLHMQFNFQTYRYFAVSALGAEPDYASGSVHTGGVRPHRAQDPILWLLARERRVARV